MAFLDETGLAELWELIKAEDAKGVKLASGTYTGTGVYGSNNKNSLTFDFVPVVVFIACGELTKFSTWHYGAAYGVGGNMYNNALAWSGKTLSWYCTQNSADSQYNESGYSYFWAAIGY